MIPDLCYWAVKIYFSMLWLIYVMSLIYGWDTTLMWHTTGILSLIFLLSNVTWHFREAAQ